MKITKNQLKRIIAEERSKLQRKEDKDFGSNTARQEQLKEVEQHGSLLDDAWKNLINEIMKVDEMERGIVARDMSEALDKFYSTRDNKHLFNALR
ncbi:hypothetical protein OAA09_00950 [bacterium]|nr:hypothetical protein [bacterium]